MVDDGDKEGDREEERERDRVFLRGDSKCVRTGRDDGTAAIFLGVGGGNLTLPEVGEEMSLRKCPDS